MALPPPTCGEMGHFTGFLGRWNYQQSWGTRPKKVAYLCAADNVSGPLPSRRRGLNQLIIHSRNLFSRPCPARLACI